MTWNPDDWRTRTALQQPDWPDAAAALAVGKELAAWPPLVFAGEVRDLKASLAEVAKGNGFLLQAGDCAESFHDHSASRVREMLKVLLQMSAIVTYAAGTPVVKIARTAGQYAKPRSSPTEMVDGVELPSFRGHIVNSEEPTLEARTPDPQRMLAAYHRAASTLNLLRAFTHGGFADLTRVHAWNQEFIASSPQGKRFERLAAEIDRALTFMRAIGVQTDDPRLHQVDVWTSHEALLLEYEQALTRTDSLTGDWYDCSGHMLWIGERTREPDGAHVQYLAGVNNPIGCKVGPTATPEDVKRLCAILDPEREAGRLTLISRMGKDKVTDTLPSLIEAVRAEGWPVIWQCDPMHGNTITASNGRKTRRLEDVVTEIDGFFAVHRSLGTHAGGVHLEITGDAVTECLGGETELTEDDLPRAYSTLCDPRLNGRQAIDLAFHVADLVVAEQH